MPACSFCNPEFVLNYSIHTALKKLAAILLIAILFFNWYGYRIVTSIMARSADRQLEVQIDNNLFDESELIEVRVALNVPYQLDKTEFERHYGEMEVDGKYYTYVKRKIENGYLVLKCIPNNSKEKIKEASKDFFKMTNGLTQDQQGKKQNNTSFAKNFWSEYDSRENEFTIDIHGVMINKYFPVGPASLYSTCLSIPSQPPEFTRFS